MEALVPPRPWSEAWAVEASFGEAALWPGGVSVLVCLWVPHQERQSGCRWSWPEILQRAAKSAQDPVPSMGRTRSRMGRHVRENGERGGTLLLNLGSMSESPGGLTKVQVSWVQ